MSAPAAEQTAPRLLPRRAELGVACVTTSPRALLAARRPRSSDPLWIADVSQVWGGTSWLYLAFVLDRDSRRCLGWSGHRTLHCDLLRDAVRVALVASRPPLTRRFRRCAAAPSEPPADVAIVFDHRCRMAGLDFPTAALRSAPEAAISRAFVAAMRHSLSDEAEWWPSQEQARTAVRAWIDGDYNAGLPAATPRTPSSARAPGLTTPDGLERLPL